MAKTDSAKPARSATKPLLSRSTILILSGFLIGIVSQQFVDADLKIYVLSAGVFGLVAFIGLEAVASRLNARATQKASKKAEAALVERVNRHVSRHASEARPLTDDASREAAEPSHSAYAPHA